MADRQTWEAEAALLLFT